MTSTILYTIVFQMHHIYSSKKKDFILKLSKQYSIQGLYKFGKPGRLILQSRNDEDLKAFERQVKSLTWQSCTVTQRRVFSSCQVKEFIGFRECADDVEVREALFKANMEEFWYEVTGFKKRVVN